MSDYLPFSERVTTDDDMPVSWQPDDQDQNGKNGNLPAPGPSVASLVDDYTEARAGYDMAMAEMERARAEVLARVQADLDAIAEEFGPKLATASQRVNDIESSIKVAVEAAGETFKGRRWEFRYTSGRRTVKVAGVDKLIKRETDPARKALLENLIEQGKAGVSVYPVK